jgi:hypothetical protein
MNSFADAFFMGNWFRNAHAQAIKQYKMKMLKLTLLASVSLFALIDMAQSQDNPGKHKHEKKDKYHYECPMKCEPPSDKPGKCGKCGMELKKVKVPEALYECPMKCEPAKDKPGKCGKCGMELKKKA